MGEKNITEKKLEKLIEQKVEKKINENRCRSRKESQKERQTDNISRRQFLKKAGITTAGLAALGLSPAASEVIIDDNQGLKMKNGDIDLNNQNITAVNKINGYEISDFL